jgi:hypothetical protein
MNAPYDINSAALSKYRWQARTGLAALSREERRVYGEAVERAVLARQRSELQAACANPGTPKARCASGTYHNDGADIHEAIRQRQRNALLAAPAKIRRARTDDEWRRMYQKAMAATIEAKLARASALLKAYREAA